MKIILFLLLTGLAGSSYAQSIKSISDQSVRNQQGRMVYQFWGNWTPKEKKIFGVNVNIHHTLVWGWLAPAQNRRYKDGPDLRPISAFGPQTQRTASLSLLRSTTSGYREQSDSLSRSAISELANYSGLAAKADYLWLLYYSKELKEVVDYRPGSIYASGSLSSAQQAYLTETGVLDWYDSELQRLHERLDAASSSDMPRGSRVLAYQRMLDEYRRIGRLWNEHVIWADRLLQARNTQQQIIQTPVQPFHYWHNTDVEIMSDVIRQAKNIHP